MLIWLEENMGTIIVCIVLLIMVACIVGKMIKDKRSGRSTCGCGCENCASKNMCHK